MLQRLQVCDMQAWYHRSIHAITEGSHAITGSRAWVQGALRMHVSLHEVQGAAGVHERVPHRQLTLGAAAHKNSSRGAACANLQRAPCMHAACVPLRCQKKRQAWWKLGGS